jgi:hypothetical protein
MTGRSLLQRSRANTVEELESKFIPVVEAVKLGNPGLVGGLLVLDNKTWV